MDKGAWWVHKESDTTEQLTLSPSIYIYLNRKEKVFNRFYNFYYSIVMYQYLFFIFIFLK